MCQYLAPMPAKAQDDAAKVLPGLEKSLWEAWKNHDPAPFEKYLAENSVNISNSGVDVGKTKQVEAIKTSDCKVASYTLGDIDVHTVGESTAILTYTASQDAVCRGQKMPAKVQASSVWVKQGGKWVVALYHESPTKM
jgi:hypothetical protein